MCDKKLIFTRNKRRVRIVLLNFVLKKAVKLGGFFYFLKAVITMLKLAYPYKEKLQQKYNEIIFQDKYMFYNCENYWDYEFKLSESSWNSIEMVSVDSKDNIIGFFRASISRSSDKVSSLGVVNFHDANPVFAKDLKQFIYGLLFKFNFRKIEWTVVIGNPAEKIYDRFISKYGGNITGTTKETVKLQDGEYYDMKGYEVFRSEFKQRR